MAKELTNILLFAGAILLASTMCGFIFAPVVAWAIRRSVQQINKKENLDGNATDSAARF